MLDLSSFSNISEPTTITLAPASKTFSTLSIFIPPSTSNSQFSLFSFI